MREAPRCRGFTQAKSQDPLTEESEGAPVLRSQRVRAVVSGGLARTEVEAELVNERARSVIAPFSFRLPVAAMPLLDQQLEVRNDILTTRGLSFTPKQRRKTRLMYDETLEQYRERQVYRFAMSGVECALPPLREFSIEVKLVGDPANLGTITTPGYQSQIVRAADGVTVKLEQRGFVPDADFTVEFSKRVPAVDVQVARAVRDATTPFPGYVSFGFELPARAGELSPAPARVLVLDKSYHQSPAALRLQARVVEGILKRAAVGERFRLLACDSACSEWRDDGANTLQRAARAAAWLATLSPSGSLDFEGALAHARALLAREARGQIVYLGSGRVSAGAVEKSAFIAACARLLTPGASDLRLFVVERQPEEALLFDLAAAAGATYAVISDTLPLELTLDELVRTLRSPKLVNVRLDLPTGVTEAVPARWPALVFGQALHVTARVSRPASGVIRISGTLDGRTYSQTYPVAVDAATPQNPAIEQWWTHQRGSGRAQVAGTPPVSRTRENLPALLPKADVTLSTVTSSDGRTPPREADSERQREIEVLTSRFRHCYERHASGPDGWFEGRLDFFLRLDAQGSLSSFAAEVSPNRAPTLLVTCLRRIAAETSYEPPRTAELELSFSQEFAIDWRRGLRAHVEVPRGAFTSQGAIDAVISPSDERWRSTLPPNTIGSVLAAATPEQMLAAARKLVGRAPRSLLALDLLAAVAGAYRERALALAVLEAELALMPNDRELRLRAARAWLTEGDERRACAHVRAASTATSELSALAATCRSRWLGEAGQEASPKPLGEDALTELYPGPSCQPFKVSVVCDASEACPIPIVLTPQGQVISPFGRIPGAGRASPLAFWPGGFGTYRVLLLGGPSLARGAVELAVHLDTQRLAFERSEGVESVAVVELKAKKPAPFATGIPLCGSGT